MDTTAYDRGLPCLNPNCKSHGRPHPNCRCYSGMAEGGEVSFCSKARMHNTDCEYYADGGGVEVPTDDIPSESAQAVPHEDMPEQAINVSALAPAVLPTQPQQEQELSGTPVPEDDQPTDYESPEQQAKTVMEGLAQGIAGPVATFAETHLLGIKPEDIAARQAANPYEHGIAEAGALAVSMLTGTGEAGLIARVLPEFKAFGKIGSTVLRGALESGLIQGGDEISDAMLGKGDPEAPVSSALAHMGAAALFGGTTAGIFHILGGGINKGLHALENAKLGTRAENLRIGLGLASKAHAEGIPLEETEEWLTKQLAQKTAGNLKPASLKEVLDPKPYMDGVRLYYTGLNKVINYAVEGAGATVGSAIGGAPGIIIGDKIANKYLAPMAQKILRKPLIGMNKLIMPVILKAMAEGDTSGLYHLMDYATKVSKGASLINRGVESVFKAGGQQAIEAVANETRKNKIRKYIEEGGVANQIDNQIQENMNTPEYAEGGEVTENQNADNSESAFATLYPAQNLIMNVAKNRVSTYLNSMRPQDKSSLPYDIKRIDKPAERQYDKALNLADQPLTILNHIKNGTLDSNTLGHAQSMYPELMDHLRKKLTKKVTETQLKGEAPPYRIRQSLSLFLSAPLESTLSPQSILDAQKTFTKPSPNQAPINPKRGTTTLGKSNKSYRTPTQAAEADRTGGRSE